MSMAQAGNGVEIKKICVRIGERGDWCE
jgi:hypothetical protein